MKKGCLPRLNLLIVFSIVIWILGTVSIFAQSPMPEILTPQQAQQAALTRIEIETTNNRAPVWVDASLGDPISMVDLVGDVSAYLFPVEKDGASAGFLTVAAYQLPNPVLEFSTGGVTPFDDNLRPRQIAHRIDTSRSPLYLGLLSYAYALEESSTDSPQIFDIFSGKIIDIAPENSNLSIQEFVGNATHSVSSFSPQNTQSYALISGVPDWNQFWGSYGCYSGCSPTSGINVLGYWDVHGYGNLIYGTDWQTAVDEIRGYMGTYCSGNDGSTNIGNISPGIESYVQHHGYTFDADLWCPSQYGCLIAPTYMHYLAEIDAGRPLVVDIINHTFYGDHSVTGVGYETNGSYMIIHDNWGSTTENYYLQYGTGYSEIFMHPVIPDGQATATPTPTTATPTAQPSGNAKLYSLANFGGSVVWQGGTGFSNNPNANSYSLEMPSGWSVKTWSDDNRGGDYRCWTSSVNNLQDHGWHLKIQSIEVYNYNACPATPTPQATATSTPTPTPTATPTSSPPQLSFYQYFVDDDNDGQSHGNDDGILNCGETVELYVGLQNTGGSTAQAPSATIDTNDSNVNWLINTSSSYPDIAVGAYVWNGNDFDFSLASNVAPGHRIYFDLDITTSTGGRWHDSFYIPVTCNAPAQPGNPYQIEVTASTITFGWADNSSYESGFKIYRWDGAAVDFVYHAQTGANINRFTDTNLPCDAQQWYKVSAFNATGESSQTPWLEARTTLIAVYLPIILKSGQ